LSFSDALEGINSLVFDHVLYVVDIYGSLVALDSITLHDSM